MPIFIQNNLQIVTSSDNEIIDINDRSMTTMSTAQVHKLIKNHASDAIPLTQNELDKVEF